MSVNAPDKANASVPLQSPAESGLGADLPFEFSPAGLLLVITGPSGAGKGTLVDALVKRRPECLFAISATTRPRRNGEENGLHYEFLSREEFIARREDGAFMEWAEVHGHLYGTPIHQVEQGIKAGRVMVLDVDVQGGASVRRVRPDAVSVFIYPPSINALRQRLLKRGTDAAEVVERRLGNAPGELEQHRHYDYLVKNDDLESAVERLVAIVDAERSKVSRLKPNTRKQEEA